METLIEQPDAPNLYWALTVLPRPFVRFRNPLLGESMLIESFLPRLSDIETTVMTVQQIEDQLNRARGAMGESAWSDTFGRPGPARGPCWRCIVAKTYPASKAALIKKGRSSNEVEAMPALQVVLLYSLDEYRRHRDALFCWADVPFWQAVPGLRRAEEDLKAARDKRVGRIAYRFHISPSGGQGVSGRRPLRSSNRRPSVHRGGSALLRRARRQTAWPARRGDGRTHSD